MAREKGIVKWFSTEKGYGFVRRESGDEVFVHHTDIEVDGYASLRNGETVEFEVFESDRGPKARKLVPLDPDAPVDASSEYTSAPGRDDSRRSSAGSRKDRSSGRQERQRGREDRGERGTIRSLAEQLRERLGARFPGLGD
jgi:CspA family cold shock protein